MYHAAGSHVLIQASSLHRVYREPAMTITSFVSAWPKLPGALYLLSVGDAVLYSGKRRLNRLCPRILVTGIPKSSACVVAIVTVTEIKHGNIITP